MRLRFIDNNAQLAAVLGGFMAFAVIAPAVAGAWEDEHQARYQHGSRVTHEALSYPL